MQFGLGAAMLADKPQIKWLDDKRMVRPNQLQSFVNWASSVPELVLDYEGDGVDARRGARSFMAGLYAPDKGPKVLELRLLREDGWRALRDALKARKGVTIVHNGKHEVSQSTVHGIEIGGTIWDNQAASYALQEKRPNGHGQKVLSEELLGRSPVMAKALHDWMVNHLGTSERGHELNPLELEVPYNCEDVTDAWDLYKYFKPQVSRAGMDALVRTDGELVRAISEMENRGVRFDTERADALAQRLSRECGDIQKQINELMGRQVDIGGRDMFGVFFGTLGVPLHKDIEKQGSLDHEVLSWIESLKDVNPKAKQLAKLVGDWRERDKLAGTYLLPWLYEHQIDGVLYPNLNLTLARTRRFTADSPNLQNVPTRTALGKLVKSMICARPGWTTYSMDYSQVEYRAFVHYAGEPLLIRGYLTDPDFDIHYQVGLLLSLTRQEGKHMNFGLLFGLGADKLARKLLVDIQKAKELKARYMARIPSVKQLQRKLEMMVRAKGYIQDALGGRRHLEVRDSYKALNSICQMGAANVMRRAIVRAHPIVKAAGGNSLLQIHDDYQFELPGTDVREHLPVLREVKRVMEDNPEYKIPLAVECERYTTNWSEKEEVSLAA